MYQRFIYMCPVADFVDTNAFFGTLFNQPPVGHILLNASENGQFPKTHCVGSTQFTETQLPEVLDWFSAPGRGIIPAEPTDYTFDLSRDNWGLRLVEDPID
jgi:hypothetical protein